MRALFPLTSLTRVDLAYITVSDDVRTLFSLMSLTHLDLFRTKVSGDGRALFPLSSLASLNLPCITVPGDVRALSLLTSRTPLDRARTGVWCSGGLRHENSTSVCEPFGRWRYGEGEDFSSSTAKRA